MNIDQAVMQFRDAAIAKATCNTNQDAALHRKMADAFVWLRNQGSLGRDAFLELLDGESDDVVVWVAAQLLYESKSAKARNALKRIAAGGGLLAFNAKMTLEEFDKERLGSPFGEIGS